MSVHSGLLFLPHNAMHVRPMLSCSVCLSIKFMNSVKTNKHVVKICSLSGSHTILVFHTKRHSDIPTRIARTGASNAGGVCRNRDWATIWLHRVLSTLWPAISG